MARGLIQFELSQLHLVQQYLRDTGERRPPSREAVAAWRLFFTQCDRLIRRYARVHVRCGDALDDCAQNVWVYLVDHLAAFRYDPARGEFTSWLYHIVRTATVNYFRHERRYRVVGSHVDRLDAADEASNPLHKLQQDEPRRNLSAMLLTIQRNVSRPNYELLRQRWVEGRSVGDVAQEMGITREQVWYREHRARKKMRQLFAEAATGGEAT